MQLAKCFDARVDLQMSRSIWHSRLKIIHPTSFLAGLLMNPFWKGVDACVPDSLLSSFAVCWSSAGAAGRTEKVSKVWRPQIHFCKWHSPQVSSARVSSFSSLSIFSKPNQDMLTEYTRKVNFLKGLIEAEKMVTLPQACQMRIVRNQFFNPYSCAIVCKFFFSLLSRIMPAKKRWLLSCWLQHQRCPSRRPPAGSYTFRPKLDIRKKFERNCWEARRIMVSVERQVVSQNIQFSNSNPKVCFSWFPISSKREEKTASEKAQIAGGVHWVPATHSALFL